MDPKKLPVVGETWMDRRQRFSDTELVTVVAVSNQSRTPMSRRRKFDADTENALTQKADDERGEKMCRCGHERHWHTMDLTFEPPKYRCGNPYKTLLPEDGMCECEDFAEGS